MNQDKEAVKVLAEEIMKAVKVIIEDNNKKYVNNQIKNHGGGSASSLSGSINASQVRNLYSTIGGYIAQAYEKSQDGDAIASAICTAITGLAGIEVKSIAADEAEIGNLYASFGKFINLVAANADIGDLKVKDIRADLATIGLTNIGSAKIKYSQITNLDADTAFIRQGVGDQVYIDNLAVTEGNIYALSVGKLMLKDEDGQMCQLTVDPNTQEIVATPVTFDGETLIEEGTVVEDTLANLAVTTNKIANNAVNGDKILAGSIVTKHLDASEIFAKNATILDLIASNIKVSQLFANTGVVGDLSTSVIHSAAFGNVLDISSNSSITLANDYIGLIVDTGRSTTSSLVLTDKMLIATAENIDLSANSSVTARIEDAIENEIITQPEEPEDPENGLIWVDISQVPNVFKQWDGSIWQLIDGSVLDGNSVLLNKLIQKMSSKISETKDEILLQITREDNAVIEGQVENLSTYVSQIDQKADSISLKVGNSTTTFVQNGTPFIQANGDVWMNPDSPDYCIGTIVNNDSNIEFAHDSDGNLLFRYNDGVELHNFQIVEDNLMVLYDDEEIKEGYMYQTSEGRVGYWRIVKNIAFSQLDVKVNEISSTVYDQNTGLSAVRQQANKITWLIKSGTSSANMELTDDALSIIANNIDLQANNTVRITSAGQITANAAKNIDLSSNTSIKITAANQITADALNGINLSSNNTVISVAENQAKIAAATKSKVYYQDAQPTGSSFNSGDIWIDTDNNNKLYLWNGSTWVLKRDTSLDYLIDVANGKTTVYYSTTQPASASTGDIWYDTSNNLIKRFVGSNWIDITSNALKQALDAAGDAQSTANSKIKTYAQNSAPTSDLKSGDLWIETDNNNKLYRYNGSQWVDVQDSHLDDTVNDLSERVEAAEIVVSNNSIQMTSLKNTFERVITIDTEGLHVGDNQNINNEILIDSDSVNIVTNGQMESKFTGNYIQFGNYQLRRTADGGLAFKLKE